MVGTKRTLVVLYALMIAALSAFFSLLATRHDWWALGMLAVMWGITALTYWIFSRIGRLDERP